METAVGLLLGYAGRKAAGLVDRAASDADAAFDTKAGQFYDWVKARLTRRRAGQRLLERIEADPRQADLPEALSDQLTDEADADERFAAELYQRATDLAAAQPTTWTVHAQGASGLVSGRDTNITAAGERSIAAGQIRDIHLGGPENPSPPGGPTP